MVLRDNKRKFDPGIASYWNFGYLPDKSMAQLPDGGIDQVCDTNGSASPRSKVLIGEINV